MQAGATSATLQDGRFLLLEALGRGGMGSVYRAYDRAERRTVALKVLDRAERTGPSHPLSAEFEIWNRLRHPNIVRAHELGRARSGPLPRGRPYLVLEFFGGRPANQALAPGSCGTAVLEEFALRVLRGLDHVHAAGLVHRDMKPGNVLVGRSHRRPGRVKLIDFGLAEQTGRSGELGRLSGSLPYVAPEAMLGRAVDGRADLYGLGILLYLLAAGRMPAPGRNVDEIIRWHLSGSTPDPRSLRPGLSERLARFIVRLTARDPDERPASASEALLLLGAQPARTPGRRPVIGRAGQAALRLAVDAVRLGGCRLFRLPASRDRADSLVREAGVLAGIHGLGFQRLRPGRGPAPLGRLVLRLLLERGNDVRRLIAKHRLHQGLPLGLLGGLPVWNRMREGDLNGNRDEASRRATARGVATFVLECSRRRSLVLCVERRAANDPLTGEVLRLLARETTRQVRPSPQRGGLLMVVDASLTEPGW